MPPLETGTYISDLVVTNPGATDAKSEGDDHLRLIKSTVKATFPNITGPITATQAELNVLDGITASTAELNLLDGVTATTAEINHIDGVTSPIQTQLDGKQPLNDELTAIAGLSSAGMVARTGAGTAAARTLTAGAGITITNGDGVSGNPTIAVNATDLPNSAAVVSYTPAGTGAVATTVQSKLREWVSVFDFMTTAQIADVQAGTALLDVTAAIQAAIDSTTGGLTVCFPAGVYKITDTILFKKNGVHLLGAGFTATRIQYVNAAGGVAVSGDSSKTASLNNYRYCSIKDITFGPLTGDATAEANDPDIYIDITSFSYSTFDVTVQTVRANGVCIYGQGNAGTSPYYNRISGFLFGGVSSGTNYTQTGIRFAQGAWAGGSNGPNANMIGPIPRAASLGILVDLQSGTGNLFNQISGESINDYYFRFNFNAAVDSGTSTGSNGAITLIDTGKTWTTNTYTGAAVKVTGGTGAGQVRIVNTNTATTLSLREPWGVIPDATSTYEIYLGKAQGNRLSQCRAEGLASLNPDFIYAAPGTDKTEVDQAEIQSLGSGLFVRDESGSPKNNWYSQSRIVMTENITNPGPSVNLDLYNRLSVLGGVRFAGNYVVEWIKVATTTTSLSDTLTARLDVGGTGPGLGDMTLLAQIPTGQSQAMAMPTSTQKILRDGTNRSVFVNVQTGAAFSATADATVTWCVTLI